MRRVRTSIAVVAVFAPVVGIAEAVRLAAAAIGDN